MNLAVKIEDAKRDAAVLRSTLLAVTTAVYSGSDSIKEYEWAFYKTFEMAHDLMENLKALTDEAYALQKGAGGK